MPFVQKEMTLSTCVLQQEERFWQMSTKSKQDEESCYPSEDSLFGSYRDSGE